MPGACRQRTVRSRIDLVADFEGHVKTRAWLDPASDRRSEFRHPKVHLVREAVVNGHRRKRSNLDSSKSRIREPFGNQLQRTGGRLNAEHETAGGCPKHVSKLRSVVPVLLSAQEDVDSALLDEPAGLRIVKSDRPVPGACHSLAGRGKHLRELVDRVGGHAISPQVIGLA